MDTSNKYKDMCSKATEIQKAWDPEPFDDFISKKSSGSVSMLGINQQSEYTFGLIKIHLDDVIWLPRQDQLQAIINKANNNKLSTYLFAHIFFEFVRSQCPDSISDSMEKAWLAYTMLCVYKKVWCDEGWVDVV